MVRRPRRHARPLRGGSLGLDALARNRTLGASALTVQALGRISIWAATARLTGPEGRRRLEAAARAVLDAQPAMGAFRRWSATLSRIARRPDDRRRTLVRSLDAEHRQLRRETMRVARIAALALPPAATYLTLSRSATVTQTLLRASGPRRPAQVWVLESLPGGEGRGEVRELSRGGVAATLAKDSDQDDLLRETDAVVLGADAVFSDRTVWNKVGTRRLVEAARSAGVPVVVLVGRSKFVASAAPRRLPSPLFDATPGRMISAFVTQEGLEPPIGRISRPRSRRTIAARGRGRRRAA
jgi:translation initiation factor 2B subunit (eIF-2B alpha/beta/delta family)